MPLPLDNHCPFGCQDHELDGDTGYCRHLVGFTNDGKLGELLQRVERTDRMNNKFYTWAQVTGKKLFRITKECVLVNPEIVVQSIGHRVSQRAYKWLSARVYHPTYSNAHFQPPPDETPRELPEFFDLPAAVNEAPDGVTRAGIFGGPPR
jgi:hypothetical protein